MGAGSIQFVLKSNADNIPFETGRQRECTVVSDAHLSF